ncbi:MAG TPA: F0F1 ATP synthase subunit B, partial [Candidatus Saccharimonadales bacterium]|nr:F0F1 ATP synthase subunit B [Candidatus Saccharimonadales bacterium]
ISSLGINLKAFIFQLITFVIVLLILNRWVFPRLVSTIEARRKTLEESLVQAKATQEALEKAEEKATEILHKARGQADQALTEARNQAKEIVAAAESTAQEQASRIIKEAQEQLDQEHNKLYQDLKSELASLVAGATEKVLHRKIDEREDRRLIEDSIKEVVR